MRSKGDQCFACGAALRGIGRVCDGVSEVRKAARDELRKGAHCIKAGPSKTPQLVLYAFAGLLSPPLATYLPQIRECKG